LGKDGKGRADEDELVTRLVIMHKMKIMIGKKRFGSTLGSDDNAPVVGAGDADNNDGMKMHLRTLLMSKKSIV
jgi:hypothetical protein